MDVVVTLPAPETRDWSELPPDALSVVFAKLGAVEILMGAGLVCRSWLRAGKQPRLWRRVDMAHHHAACCAMANVAVDLSDGRLEVFEPNSFVNDDLLVYVADSCQVTVFRKINIMILVNSYTGRSPCVKSLRLECSSPMVSERGLAQLISMTPQLEELVLQWPLHTTHLDVASLGIAKLHQLRHLNVLADNTIDDKKELTNIIDGCPHLELLDVSRSIVFDVVDDVLLAKCATIKITLKPPFFFDIGAIDL
ncbi:LOW QUALITY PROTEIN: putative F-box/LRR-repeat protein 9 [Oryza brachyantha]|uniref:LOW QUALITY PROTEIN: putative F-box/LRR-repeat protein 9 n=1 Tax=Oryza brachyantha TaxID=4533 RepID=UPI001AD9D5FF|nr:LOW QUALITY PROTEIN: putative F-box/LRR-repeat protein 9 [Oryza brachyantha]